MARAIKVDYYLNMTHIVAEIAGELGHCTVNHLLKTKNLKEAQAFLYWQKQQGKKCRMVSL